LIRVIFVVDSLEVATHTEEEYTVEEYGEVGEVEENHTVG
jgi:hypothetical protein